MAWSPIHPYSDSERQPLESAVERRSVGPAFDDRYAVLVPRTAEPAHAGEQPPPGTVRDPRADVAMVIAARRRPMSERLELALSWNAVAAELRAGLAAINGRTTSLQ